MSWVRALPPSLRAAGGGVLRQVAGWVAEFGAIGPEDRRARCFGSFGEGSCLVYPQGSVYNEHYIGIGRDTVVGPYTSLTAGMVPGQQMPSDPVVRIGDRCVIGRGSHIVGHWEIVLGDDILTGPYVYITDQNHTYADPSAPVGRQWPAEESVHVGSGSWLGAHVVLLPGTHLGVNTVVAAGAVVRGTFPDHCVVAGVPARLVRHWRPGEGWVRGQQAAWT